MSSHSSGCHVGTSGLFPAALIDAVKSAAIFASPRASRSVTVEWRMVEGIAREARVKTSETFVLVPLSS